MALALVQQQDINLNQQALDEFIEHRIELKRPMTPLAIKKAANILKPFPFDHQQYMVDTAIISGWRGLFPVDPPRQISTKQPTLQQDLNDTSWAS